MKQFFITLAGVFAGLLLFFVGLPLVLVAMAVGSAKPAATPDATVLALDLRGSLNDQDSAAPFAFSGPEDSVLGIIRTLRRAEDDDKIKGLFIRLPETGMAPAAAEELRTAIQSFRRSGKVVVAHSQGLYPAGPVVSTYMLGAAANEFWMQENASLQAVGFASEEMFLKGAFDRYGIVPDFQKRAEYKTAPNAYLETNFTPEHRESQLSWMGSVYGSAVANAAADRKQPVQTLRAALEGGPYTAPVARQRGLIDKLGQVEQAEKALLDRFGDDAELVELEDYGEGEDEGSGPVIAVVEAEGAIVTGKSEDAGFGAAPTVYSDDLARALYDAAEDDDVKAVVFRISSPGGSDTASEQILGGVRAVKAAGKPVVVSMGTYAASGGYWIASQADRIIAQPTTITGSIGVFGGKFAIGPALERFGVNLEEVAVGGEFATAYSAETPFNQAQRAAFSALIDQTYREFVQRVAVGRKLDPARVNEIARGRVWTGVQAKQLGLIDGLGGFYAAVAEAKRLAKIDADEDVTFRRLPGEKNPFEALEGMFGVSASSVRTLAAAGWLLGDPRATRIMDTLAEARMRDVSTGRGGATVMADRPF